jgi:threonine dehydrogenase-like Zn-dependent dehydrogenase
MKAVCWHGAKDVRVDNVPDPKILNPRDAIIKITSTAICGSDLHLYEGNIPTMKSGDILGHEFMGEVVEVGSRVNNLKVGDRVVVPFTISCGSCFFCNRDLWSLCDNSNPNGWMAAEHCNIQPGDTIAVWGCGPVGQFAIASAYMLGAERVIAIDRFPERLQMAKERGRAEIINYEEVHDVGEVLKEMTGGRGPDSCIDAVGMEAHGTDAMALYDKIKQAVRLETDRPFVLRQAIVACRKGGIVSVPGVYGGFIDKMPMGAIVNKGLTLRSGQTHVHKYLRPLLERIQNGEIDPSFVITHRLNIDEAPKGYEIFKKKEDNCIKVVLKP